MSELARWLGLVVGWCALPVFTITAVILHSIVRRWSSICLAFGLSIATAGEFIQLLSPITPSAAQQPLRLQIHESWYVGDALFYMGLAIACAGFTVFTFSMRRGTSITSEVRASKDT